MATGWIEQKRRWRQYKARKEQLPASYHTAIDALERYTSYLGHGTAEGGLTMLEDLADLFEQGAANRTPVRQIVGIDPVEFADAFLRNYPVADGQATGDWNSGWAPGAGSVNRQPNVGDATSNGLRMLSPAGRFPVWIHDTRAENADDSSLVV